jgi:hypothetical protein
MVKPGWRNLELDDWVLREPTPDGTRLVLWLPQQVADGSRRWERIANVPGAAVRVEKGLRALPATLIGVCQKAHGLVGKLFQCFRKAADSPTWLLPNGQTGQQEGERQTDLLLVWSCGAEQVQRRR